jgi:hypothetical protein
MPEEMILQIVESFGKAAALVKRADLNGHDSWSTRGYSISSFLRSTTIVLTVGAGALKTAPSLCNGFGCHP